MRVNVTRNHSHLILIRLYFQTPYFFFIQTVSVFICAAKKFPRRYEHLSAAAYLHIYIYILIACSCCSCCC